MIPSILLLVHDSVFYQPSTNYTGLDIWQNKMPMCVFWLNRCTYFALFTWKNKKFCHTEILNLILVWFNMLISRVIYVIVYTCNLCMCHMTYEDQCFACSSVIFLWVLLSTRTKEWWYVSPRNDTITKYLIDWFIHGTSYQLGTFNRTYI